MSMNKITLKGYVVGDAPEVKTTPSGATVVKFSLSVYDPFLKNKEDNTRKYVSFFNCENWPTDKIEGNVQKEIAKLAKGSYIAFDARPVQDRWEHEGQKRSNVKFIVEGFIEELHHPVRASQQQQPEQAPDVPPTFDDDIPF
jgi:single-stranded DNA-binding protein